jgi:hypothetical protein
LSQDHANKLEAISLWEWVQTPERQWNHALQALQKFVTREGHSQVPQNHKENEFTLGTWVTSQRTTFNKKTLSSERISKLENIHGWEWSVSRADTTSKAFSALAKYVAKEGMSRIPRGIEINGFFNLRAWVDGNRARYRLGKLSKNMVDRFESIPGWDWYPKNYMDEAWERGLQSLKMFVEQNGHARLARNYVDDSFKLGNWVSLRRTDYARGKITQSQIAELESLPGWIWNTVEAQWEEGFVILQNFANREGHASPPGKHIENGFNLAGWVKWKRSQYKNEELDQSKIDLLEALPGWVWNAVDAKWEEVFAALELFAKLNGHSTPKRGSDEDKLARWVEYLRKRKSESSDYRVRKLESLPGWTWSRETI